MKTPDPTTRASALLALPSVILGCVPSAASGAILVALSAPLGSPMDRWCREHLVQVLGLSRGQIAKLRAVVIFGVHAELRNLDDLSRSLMLGRALERANLHRVAPAA